MASGRIAFARSGGNASMHRIVGDHEDRPYDAMAGIGCIDATLFNASGRIAFARVGAMHPMHRVVGDREDRPYDAMAGIAYIANNDLTPAGKYCSISPPLPPPFRPSPFKPRLRPPAPHGILRAPSAERCRIRLLPLSCRNGRGGRGVRAYPRGSQQTL